MVALFGYMPGWQGYVLARRGYVPGWQGLWLPCWVESVPGRGGARPVGVVGLGRGGACPAGAVRARSRGCFLLGKRDLQDLTDLSDLSDLSNIQDIQDR